MTARLFHFLHPGAWQLGPSGTYAPASLASEGFCHFSLADQLLGTLQTHFDPENPPWLVEVELADESALRFEASRGGADFPHLYRPLEAAELARHWVLDPRNENWGLPKFGSAPDRDEPPGNALPPL